jgi:anthranilate phosphoribosyltransferase
MLSAYGCLLPNVSPDNIPRIYDETNFCFLLAPLFHPALAKIAPIRKSIGVPTIFNILGPLLNPATISSRLIGVSDRRLGEVFAQALLLMSCERVMIVWGEDGLDEISPAGPTQIWRIVPGSRAIYQSVVTPSSFGLKSHPLDDVKSGSPEDNAEQLKALLSGKMADGHPIKDFALMNAAALLVVAGKCAGWKEGVKMARESLDGGAALAALESFKRATLDD